MGTCYTLKLTKKQDDDDFKEVVNQYNARLNTEYNMRKLEKQNTDSQKLSTGNDDTSEDIFSKISREKMAQRMQDRFLSNVNIRANLKLEHQLHKLQTSYEGNILFIQDGIFSNYALQLFSQEHKDLQKSRNEIMSGSQFIIETPKLTVGDDFMTFRYCVVYEFENKESNQQFTIQELTQIWLDNIKDPSEEQFSLEKISYFTVQMLQHLVFLQSLNIFAYLEMTDQTLVINQNQEILIKSDLSQSFKFQHVKVTNPQDINLMKQQKNSRQSDYVLDFEKRLTQQVLAKDMHLQLNLMRYNPDQYKMQFLVKDKKLAQYNTRLQIALIFQTILDKFDKQIDMPLLKSGILSQGFEKPKVQRDIEDMQFNEYFINKIYLMIYTSRAYIKLKRFQEAQQLLQELQEYFGSHEESASNIKYQKEQLIMDYEIAKCSMLMGEKNQTLDIIGKIYEANMKRYSDLNKFSIKCLDLQFKCYLRSKDYDKAMKYLESKLSAQVKIHVANPYAKQIGKTYYQMGITFKKINKYKQALFYVEKAYSTFTKVLGDINKKTLEVLQEFSQLQIKCGEHRQALKNYQFLLSQHTFVYNHNHVEIYQDNKFIAQCSVECKEYELAQYHLQQCLQIAEKIFIVIESKQSNTHNGGLIDKDSVFESLDLENEQYSFLNYLQAMLYMEGFKDFEKAESYFKIALKHINKLSNKQHQIDFIAQIHHNNGLNFMKLKKLDKARINLEYALEYYENQDSFDKYYYETTRKIYFAIIHVKKDQSSLIPAEYSAKNFVNYLKSVIVRANKQKLPTFEIELDLVNAYELLLQFYRLKDYKKNQESLQIERQVTIKNNKSQGGDQIDVAKQIQEIYLDQLRIYEKDVKNHKGDYLKLLMNMGQFYMDIEDYTNALKYCQKSKENYEQYKGQDDYQKLFEITNNLAQAHYKQGNQKEALIQYKMIIQHQDTKYKDILNSMPTYDAYHYHKKIGELFEQNSNYKEAAFRFEKCLKLLPDLFENDLERKTNEEMILLASVAYCFNIAGAFEMALDYQKQLHEINSTQFGLHHPNTLNSSFGIIKLIQKLKYNVTKELQQYKKTIKSEIIETIQHLSDKYQKFPILQQIEEEKSKKISKIKKILSKMSQEEIQQYEIDLEDYNLLKQYLTSESIIQLLNQEYQPNKDTDFNFLKEFIEYNDKFINRYDLYVKVKKQKDKQIKDQESQAENKQSPKDKSNQQGMFEKEIQDINEKLEAEMYQTSLQRLLKIFNDIHNKKLEDQKERELQEAQQRKQIVGTGGNGFSRKKLKVYK
eukprot:403369592